MQNNVLENAESISLSTKIVEVKDRSLIDKRKIFLTVKRTSDVVISSVTIIILMPLLLLIGILIKIDSKGPVMYKQKRIGKNGKYFMIYKFRTMVTDSQNFKKYFSSEQMKEYKENYKVKDDPRITKIGKILRKTSLDELPQLINILKGDLSIIGPRPVVDSEIENMEYIKINS